jgi:hypothetical protein
MGGLAMDGWLCFALNNSFVTAATTIRPFQWTECTPEQAVADGALPHFWWML